MSNKIVCTNAQKLPTKSKVTKEYIIKGIFKKVNVITNTYVEHKKFCILSPFITLISKPNFWLFRFNFIVNLSLTLKILKFLTLWYPLQIKFYAISDTTNDKPWTRQFEPPFLRLQWVKVWNIKASAERGLNNKIFCLNFTVIKCTIIKVSVIFF